MICIIEPPLSDSPRYSNSLVPRVKLNTVVIDQVMLNLRNLSKHCGHFLSCLQSSPDLPDHLGEQLPLLPVAGRQPQEAPWEKGTCASFHRGKAARWVSGLFSSVPDI